MIMKPVKLFAAVLACALAAIAVWSCSSEGDEPVGSRGQTEIPEWLYKTLYEFEMGYIGPDQSKQSPLGQMMLSSNGPKVPLYTTRIHSKGDERYYSQSMFYYSVHYPALDPRGEEQLYPYSAITYLEHICLDAKGNRITDPVKVERILDMPHVFIPYNRREPGEEWCKDGYETDFVRYRQNDPYSVTCARKDHLWTISNLPGVYEDAFKQHGENLMGMTVSFLYDKISDTLYEDIAQHTMVVAVACPRTISYVNTYFVKTDAGYMEVTKDEFLDASAAKFDTPEMFEANGVYKPTEGGDYINQCIELPRISQADIDRWKDNEKRGVKISYI